MEIDVQEQMTKNMTKNMAEWAKEDFKNDDAIMIAKIRELSNEIAKNKEGVTCFFQRLF